MDKSEVRVFIVEDDMTTGKAILEAIKKMGFNAVLCANAVDAQNQLRVQGAQLLIVDCLLPKISGVDFVTKFRTEGGEKTPVILMSAIYKDKAFIKDALQKSKANAFLVKPFKMDELIKLTSELLSKVVDRSISPIESLLLNSPSPAEKIQLVKNLDQLEGFDIPWICTQLMHPSISGTLSLQSESEKSALSFSKGKIVQVEMQNPESYFGALLVEGGYLTPEQVDEALKVQAGKKVGETLVGLNLLSPHVIDVINSQQMAIRLSKIISDSTFKVSWTEKTFEPTSSAIDFDQLAPFLADWVNSKIQVPWLHQRYLQWLASPVAKVGNQSTHRSIWGFPPLKNVPSLVAQFEKGFSLSQVISQGQHKEELVYQVFHLLILIDYIKLKREERPTDESAQIARLQRIWSDMQTQDCFAMLGVSKNAKPADIKRTYHELAKIFHPDRIPATASAQLKDLAQKVFSQMTKAYETLSDDKKKAAHLKEMELGRAEKILQAESLLEDGKALLKQGQATKALERFEEAARLRPPNSELLIYQAWAKMVAMAGKVNEESMMQVEGILNKIPPEDRHNATYYYVKGLFQYMLGDQAACRKNVTHALSLNPKFIEAERLIRTLDLKRDNKPVDILSGDIGEVVTSLFKRKG
ncbi:MAG: response regulator [Oligoflexia bacterium]|nr:response regulator [Oligoflexia bacterium]